MNCGVCEGIFLKGDYIQWTTGLRKELYKWGGRGYEILSEGVYTCRVFVDPSSLGRINTRLTSSFETPPRLPLGFPLPPLLSSLFADVGNSVNVSFPHRRSRTGS